ncbi:MAG: GspE/PulE family protein [Candidatus Saccharimonadales bacterium]
MSILSLTSEQQVEELLVSSGLIDAQKLEKLTQEAKDQKTPLFAYLIKNGLISDEDLTKVTAKATRVPYVNLSTVRIDHDILKLLPQDIAERYMAVPLGEMQHKLVVAMLDAGNVQAVDFLSNKVARPLKVYAASESGIRQILKQYSTRLDTSLGNELNLEDTSVEVPKSAADIKTIVQDSPISKALTAVLDFAARNRASDVHIEPTETDLKIRVRIDGILREIMRMPKSSEPAMVSRIKILANLKIDEHRIPQDGQFTIRVDEKVIDLRIAIAPIVWGEQVVIRLLDKTGTSLKLEDMGYSGRPLRLIRESIKLSTGMVLTSGPTGSGKSTSLYALIQEIKDDSINIVTLEDPVEYKMSGINQIQVNQEVGLTFSSGLRSILRQDPDVIMVGEIRDAETAQLAVQSALTGHLVFSTLHTNSAAGILPRLLDMGVEPFLIASTVKTVIGQRLVRRVSANADKYESSAAETQVIKEAVGSLLPQTSDKVEAVSNDLGFKNLPLATQSAYTLYKGKDTVDTPGGYRGRMGIYEVFSVTEQIQELIMKRATTGDIERLAKAQGMISMRQDGFLKALDGKTTLQEVNRVAAAELGEE